MTDSRTSASVVMAVIILLIVGGIVGYYIYTESGGVNQFIDELDEDVSYDPKEECLDCVDNSSSDKKQVFNVADNVFTYEEARGLCRAHGGDLATLEQMIEAHKSGADWCNYGWSDGQMALYPTQVKTYNKLEQDPSRQGECGKPGVNGGFFRNPNLQFGANCYAPKRGPEGREVEKTPSDYMLDPLDLNASKYVDRLKEFKISPFSSEKWSYYQGNTAPLVADADNSLTE
jgi:hypothetical protein